MQLKSKISKTNLSKKYPINVVAVLLILVIGVVMYSKLGNSNQESSNSNTEPVAISSPTPFDNQQKRVELGAAENSLEIDPATGQPVNTGNNFKDLNIDTTGQTVKVNFKVEGPINGDCTFNFTAIKTGSRVEFEYSAKINDRECAVTLDKSEFKRSKSWIFTAKYGSRFKIKNFVLE